MANTAEHTKRSITHRSHGPVTEGPFIGIHGEPKYIGRDRIAAMIGSQYEPWGTERIRKNAIPTVVKVTVEYSDGRKEVWSE